MRSLAKIACTDAGDSPGGQSISTMSKPLIWLKKVITVQQTFGSSVSVMLNLDKLLSIIGLTN